MKITVLIENTSPSENLACEHGLSLFIETDSHKILFDMGQTSAFAANAEKLGINLAEADLAVLSHGHYDHGGGLARFLEINSRAPVYLARTAFGKYYHGPEKYIGLNPSLAENPRLIFADDTCIIDPSLSLHTHNKSPLHRPINPFGLSELTPQGHVPDSFSHEHCLLIREHGKKILISGCAHKGVVNIVRWFRPDVLIGGFHLTKLSPENPAHRAELDETAASLMELPATYYTGHCTGETVYNYLKSRMTSRLNLLTTGLTFEI